MKILFFDLETAGVQGLKADRGFVVCFGYRWEDDKKSTVLRICDFPGKTRQDDGPLLREAYKIMRESEGLVAHFGEKFDRRFLEGRFIKARLPGIPPVRLCDTCLISHQKFAFSSNRLGNLAEFLDVPVKKMEKRGGWPDWWMGALRGDKESIRKMAIYCAQDVDCLRDVYLRIRSRIPSKFLPINKAIGQDTWACAACSSSSFQFRGTHWSERRSYVRIQCKSCGKWDHLPKFVARTAK